MRMRANEVCKPRGNWNLWYLNETDTEVERTNIISIQFSVDAWETCAWKISPRSTQLHLLQTDRIPRKCIKLMLKIEFHELIISFHSQEELRSHLRSVRGTEIGRSRCENILNGWRNNWCFANEFLPSQMIASQIGINNIFKRIKFVQRLSWMMDAVMHDWVENYFHFGINNDVECLMGDEASRRNYNYYFYHFFGISGCHNASHRLSFAENE